MAISRASFENIPVNLITAVPSVETYENIKKKKYNISKLNQRYKNASLPNYEIINLNKVKLENQSWISKEIIKKVRAPIKLKTILENIFLQNLEVYPIKAKAPQVQINML